MAVLFLHAWKYSRIGKVWQLNLPGQKLREPAIGIQTNSKAEAVTAMRPEAGAEGNSLLPCFGSQQKRIFEGNGIVVPVCRKKERRAGCGRESV